MSELHLSGQIDAGLKLTGHLRVVRLADWDFVYLTLGFALSIEGSVVSMVGIKAPWSVLLFGVLVIGTLALFKSTHFRRWLIKLRERYEGDLRDLEATSPQISQASRDS